MTKEELREFVYTKERYLGTFATNIGINANYFRQVIGGHKPIAPSLLRSIDKVYSNQEKKNSIPEDIIESLKERKIKRIIIEYE